MTSAISIIIPTHNTRDLTVACLQSIVRASDAAAEVIVVDDGGVDDTVERVREQFPTTKIISVSPPGGFTTAANRGLREASGELLFLLNSDAEIDPDTLPRFREAFAARPRLGAAGATLRFPDGRPQWSGGAAPDLRWIFALASGLTGSLDLVPGYRTIRPLDAARRGPVGWVTGAAMVIRRAAYDEIGALDERFRFYCQDLDYCMRLRDAQWEVAIAPEARVLHHGGATISKRGGSVKMRYNPELLWTDLVRFADKRYGPSRARSFARIFRYGGWMRVYARRLAARRFSGLDRAQWNRDTEAFARALSALSAWR